MSWFKMNDIESAAVFGDVMDMDGANILSVFYSIKCHFEKLN